MKSMCPLLSSSFSKDKKFIVRSAEDTVADNLSSVDMETSTNSAGASVASGFFTLVSVSICCITRE